MRITLSNAAHVPLSEVAAAGFEGVDAYNLVDWRFWEIQDDDETSEFLASLIENGIDLMFEVQACNPHNHADHAKALRDMERIARWRDHVWRWQVGLLVDEAFLKLTGGWGTDGIAPSDSDIQHAIDVAAAWLLRADQLGFQVEWIEAVPARPWDAPIPGGNVGTCPVLRAFMDGIKDLIEAFAVDANWYAHEDQVPGGRSRDQILAHVPGALGEILRSVRAGRVWPHWSAIYSSYRDMHEWSVQNGIRFEMIFGSPFDPTDVHHVFRPTTDAEFAESTDEQIRRVTEAGLHLKAAKVMSWWEIQPDGKLLVNGKKTRPSPETMLGIVQRVRNSFG